ANNQRPLILHGEDEQSVPARGNAFSAYIQVGIGDERSCLISPRAPDLAEGYQIAENLAAAHTRAGVIDRDRFPVGELACGLGGWTLNLAVARGGHPHEAE